MQQKNVINLIKAATAHDKKVMGFALILLTLSGLLEGVSIIAILPVLGIALDGGGNSGASAFGDSGIQDSVISALNSVGLNADLVTLLSIIVIGIVMKAVLLLWAQSIVGKSAVEYAAQKRNEMLSALMGCRWPYFVQKSTGKISSALTTESNLLAAMYTAVITFYSLVLQLLVYAAIALFISWQMLLGAVFVGAFMILLLKGIVVKSRVEGQIQVDAIKALNDKLIDGLRILKPLKAMARQQQIVPLLEDSIDKLKTSNYRVIWLTNFVRLSQEPIITIFLAIGIFVIVSYASLSMATLLFTVLIYHRMVTRIGLVQSALQKIIAQQDSYWSIAEIIEETKSQQEANLAGKPAPIFSKAIQVKDIEFQYGDNVILDKVSVSIPAKNFVSFVGPSGAGKTTLMELLLGLNTPAKGELFIDGEPLSEMSLESWRGQIGFVPQEVVLTNDTVFNNVTLYNSDIDEDAVIDALAKAGAWDFIKDLPEGLQTVAGEQGARFSGGQRQRISIARALVHKPALLILDEPTTALDPQTEEAICQTLKDLASDTTVIAISHQKKIAETSDIVFHMENGKIIQRKEAA